MKELGYFKRFRDDTALQEEKKEEEFRWRDAVIFAADSIPEFSAQSRDVITLIRIIERSLITRCESPPVLAAHDFFPCLWRRIRKLGVSALKIRRKFQTKFCHPVNYSRSVASQQRGNGKSWNFHYDQCSSCLLPYGKKNKSKKYTSN